MTKTEELRQRLLAGWCAVPSLCVLFGWKPHTLRAQISILKPPAAGKIERKRENGVTSYRITEAADA